MSCDRTENENRGVQQDLFVSLHIAAMVVHNIMILLYYESMLVCIYYRIRGK